MNLRNLISFIFLLTNVTFSSGGFGGANNTYTTPTNLTISSITLINNNTFLINNQYLVTPISSSGNVYTLEDGTIITMNNPGIIIIFTNGLELFFEEFEISSGVEATATEDLTLIQNVTLAYSNNETIFNGILVSNSNSNTNTNTNTNNLINTRSHFICCDALDTTTGIKTRITFGVEDDRHGYYCDCDYNDLIFSLSSRTYLNENNLW